MAWLSPESEEEPDGLTGQAVPTLHDQAWAGCRSPT